MSSIPLKTNTKDIPGSQKRSVVFIVCGGAKSNIGEMQVWKDVIEQYLDENGRAWGVECNGENWSVAQ